MSKTKSKEKSFDVEFMILVTFFKVKLAYYTTQIYKNILN